MTYATTEAALKDLIIANISGYSTNNTKCGDEDAAFKYANINGGNVCLLDYAGGNYDPQKSIQGTDDNWLWNCQVTFFLLYNATTIETDLRAIADAFVELRANNKRLSTGATWRIEAARAYQIVQRNDRPYVPVAFMVSIKETI